MKILTQLAMALMTVGLFAQTPEDPVLQARAARGLSENLVDGDLPPVPRVITEPPPLPPPEIHHKDLRPSRASRRAGRHRAGRQTRVKAPHVARRAPKKHK